MNKLKRSSCAFLSSVIVLISGATAFAQQSFGGWPLSFSSTTFRSTSVKQTPEFVIPLNFNVDDEMQRAHWGIGRRGKNPSIGRLIPHTLDFAQQAAKVFSTESTEVYRMIITTEGTPGAVNLYYSDFTIPEGGKLYIYDREQKKVLGSYTADTHKQKGSFATEPLPGNTLVLEYERPLKSPMPSIKIEALGYLFRPVLLGAEVTGGLDQSDPYISTACQININCPQGEEWQDEKAGVVTYIQLIDDFGVWVQSACSGNLMNNSAEDFKPYILTAAHCAGERLGSSETTGQWAGGFKIPQEKMDQWIFGFHYERPRCSSGELAHYNVKTLTGCQIRSYISPYGASDGMLLELNQQVPEDYRVYYNGFDATEAIPTKGVGIHHPAQDSKKIAVLDGEVALDQWFDGSSRGGADDHFRFLYKEGQTEGGSSGSSLFAANKLVVATLTGGENEPCGGHNYYGRMFSHWDKYKSQGPLTYMSKFLDPLNKGRKLTGTWRNGYKPLQTLKKLTATISPEGKHVTLAWDPLPAHEQGYAISYSVYCNGEKLAELDASKNSYTDAVTYNRRAAGVVHYTVVPRYTIAPDKKEATAPIRTTLFLGKVHYDVPEKDIQRTQSDKGVVLTWNQIINAQAISKFDPDQAKYVTVNGPKKVASYFTYIWMTDIWRTEALGTGDNLYLSQINFVPARTERSYSLLINQRGQLPLIKTFRVSKTEGDITHKMIPVVLEQPFKVDPLQNLYVGYQQQYNYPHGVRVAKGSTDENYIYDGLKVLLIGNSDLNGMLFDFTSDFIKEVPRIGYLAMELVFTDSPQPLTEPITDPWIRSRHAASFPIVKYYEVYKNGTLVGKTASASETDRTYTDAEGKENDRYSIKAVYDYPQELANEQLIDTDEPYLYPAVFDNNLRLSRPDAVESIRLYNLQGVEVLALDASSLESSIDTESLAKGTYMAVIRTGGKQINQKVIKH